MRDPSPRLGRGLAALLGDSLQPPPPSSIGMMDVHTLEPSPFQPRGAIREDDLNELAASIRARGVLQPILVRPHPGRPGQFQIIAGERRWRAAQLAGVTSVPCFVRNLADTDASAAALVENLQRKDLNPIEEAEGFRRLVEEFGLTQEELGVAIGKSRSHVANLMRLLALPGDVIAFVRDGTLSAGHARAALACADPAAAAAQMIARGLNVRQAEALATPKSPKKPDGSAHSSALAQSTADLRAVEADLAEQLGLQVAISFNGKGGAVTLHYQTLDQLDHIIAKLGHRSL
ncbi:ParB/RepB/Spo0J family partition protein [Acidisphaera sp. L21]|uniref:ParB/RepB/Spo0J family partition protein n=1 Tax=Acidisphaera sp. L21 TaxID=1641851 RepID=UPI00131E3529|nr:ParB/RepB/Spo0J family partition protein [Acidisphaera sp. L21]